MVQKPNMKRLYISLLLCTLTTTILYAQADRPLDTKTLQADSIILQQMILPVVKDGLSQNQEPDWTVLRTTIVSRYDTSYGDRNIIKAKIYYFYSLDWAKFSAALVQYTNAYEYKGNLKLMNKNAKMILEHSQDPAEWKAAQAWVKNAVEKDPTEEKYKSTYDALTAKINSK